MKNAIREFLNYTEKYDLKDENIKRKQQHSLRVMEISSIIAKKLNLTHEQVEVATLIGLLHDISRFEQYKQYKTYVDLKSFDHGDYGVVILKKDIRKYIETDKFDQIIFKAIKNHNKFKIEEGLTDEEEIFAKIIRDADKIDILYEATGIFWKDIKNEIEKSTISDEALEQFNKETTIKNKKNIQIENKVDIVIRTMALIFDLNYKTSFEIIKKEDYINKIIERFEFENERTKLEIENIKNNAYKFINKKLKETE